MCGIVGYIGDRKAAPILLSGLSKLEYRGYDSAGVAVYEDQNLEVVKTKGRLKALEERLQGGELLSARMGIGHTRWATHGEPNDINSHPHLSETGEIAVVHNGIIENYISLKEFLISQGVCFVSETDTEVIAQLIAYNYNGDIVKAVQETLHEIKGSYALGVICKHDPDMFIAARKDSPLIVGIGENENYIASDIPAILDQTRDIYILEDKEIAVLRKDGVQLYNEYGVPIQKEIFHVDWDVDAAEKGGYEHFMMKEMFEEPKAVKDTVNARIQDGSIRLDTVDITKEELNQIDKIFIVACGTAYHAGIVGKYLIEKMAGIPVEVDIASEFRYRRPLVHERCMTIIISQSGETLDTLFALREAKKKGSKIVSIVNVVGSSIARDSDNVIYTLAGPEIAVASTKAYNTQLAALYLIAIDFAYKKEQISKKQLEARIKELQQIPDQIQQVLESREGIQKFAANHYNAKSIFFIGRGLDYALSMEGSLKLKEISYIHSEAYAGGELKHGTIALIEEGTLVLCAVTQDELVEKMISNIREVKARGAVVMAITQKRNRVLVETVADTVIEIPDTDSEFAPLTAATVMQLFAYYVSVLKGCDVDKPRNLAKSVTVE